MVELAWLLPVLALAGVVSGLFTWSPSFDRELLILALIAVIAPSLGEELLFRVAIMPKPRPDEALPFPTLLLSTLLFVGWHPLQALAFGGDWARLMLDPRFLLCVAALGVACGRVYWRIGSIWPAIFLHWLVVVIWKALFGGPSPWLT